MGGWRTALWRPCVAGNPGLLNVFTYNPVLRAQGRETIADMKTALRISGSFLVSLVLLVIGAFIRQPHECADCFQPHGFPFTYRQDGGFGGGAAFYPRWLAADLLVLALLTGFIAWVWIGKATAKQEREAGT